MKRVLLFLLFFGTSLKGISQREATNWYFGKKAGFNFSNASPVMLNNSPMESEFACATISDKTTGELLFYMNGENVWNRQHRIMPNGTGIIPGKHHLVNIGHNYLSQGALIVPDPGNSNWYYLFTLDLAMPLASLPGNLTGAITGLYYSVVDMHLDNNNGDIIPSGKNIFVADGLIEKLTAVPHTNGRDFWIITHEWANNVFQVRLLTSNGLAEPKRIAIGPPTPFNLPDTVGLINNGRFAGHEESAGILKASPNGKKLACSSAGKGHVSLFDFDASTGNISNQIDLGSFIDAYALSFSPDNTKLYIDNYNLTPDKKSRNLISQYDLESGDTNAIIASGKSIIYGNPNTNINITPEHAGSWFYALQIGLDGRIYGNNGYEQSGKPNTNHNYNMFVINKPNALGFASDIQYKPFDFIAEQSNGGLPNFMQSYFNGLEPRDDDGIVCSPDSAITIFPNPTKNIFKINVNSVCFQVKTISIVNSIGQKVASLPIEEGTGEIDMSKLAAGLYLLQIANTTKQIIKKVIKIK